MAVHARHLAAGVGALGLVALAVSACGPVTSLEFDTVQPSDQSSATITAQPSGGKKVDPSQRLVVTANDGQFAQVTVRGPKGVLKGELSPDGSVWTAKRATLAFGARYSVQATAVDARGVPTTHTDEFKTLQPKDLFTAQVDPGEGATVGVGMPITVTFDREIKNKEEVERALTVYTPTPLEGAWSWNGSDSVQFRPKHYWPGNIDVTVALNLKGIQGAKGVYGTGNKQTTFHIGPSMVTKINADTHEARVFRDGEKLRTIPVTTGKAGFETRSGTVLVISKERTRVMDAATGGTAQGDPEYYRIEVEYAMRITYSGEFLHAAPWSVGSQGYANVSHGCVGMSTTNAEWLYGLSSIGDVVEITGTDNPQNLGNGITVWTETWDEWLQNSRTGAVMTTAAVAPTPDATDLPTPVSTATASPSPAPGSSSPSASASVSATSSAPTSVQAQALPDRR